MYDPVQSCTHSCVLPCISKRPQEFASFVPTGNHYTPQQLYGTGAPLIDVTRQQILAAWSDHCDGREPPPRPGKASGLRGMADKARAWFDKARLADVVDVAPPKVTQDEILF